jgi:stage VI sporulation protein D
LKGGSSLSNDESVFSFELNESLFFEKGQEVAEMRGISLDPEITIQTFNDYISIVGKMELRGEYEKTVSTDMEKMTDFTDYQAKRYVEKVVDTENNVAVFSHRFPVEISIPAYRVSDINDITVNIEAFDYEFPDPGHLELYSTIEIHGINSEIEAPFFREKAGEKSTREEDGLKETITEQPTDNRKPEEEAREQMESEQQMKEEQEPREEEQEQVEAEAQEQVNLEQVEEEQEPRELVMEEQEEAQEQLKSSEQGETQERDDSLEVGDSFQFDMKEKQQKESLDEEKLLNTDQPPALTTETEMETEAYETETDGEEVDPDRWKYKETKTLAEFFNTLPSQESEEEQEEEQEQEEQEEQEDAIEETDDMLPTSQYDEIDMDSTELEEESSERIAGVTYLSDMFRETEERQYAKMRLCIVQDQDTIESIAERYHISALQLIKQNHLDEDYNIEEGQLLNIPMQKEK